MANAPERGYTHEAADTTQGDSGLWRALETLPRRQRAVLVLRYYETLSDEEISHVLGISRGTVRSQASRGLEKLRQVWHDASETVIEENVR